MPRPALVVPAVAVLLVTALASGCAGKDENALVAAPAGVSVSVLQYRSDYTDRQLEIKVTNAGHTPVTVTAARLTSPDLDGPTVWRSRDRADEAVIGPGTATDLPAPLSDVDCAATGGRATVELDLRQGDTVVRTRALPAGDPYATLAGVHEEDCRREAALSVARPALGPLRITTRSGPGRPGLIGRLDLTLTPTGRPGTLTVDSIGSTTLLGPPTGATWPVGRTVSAGSGVQTVVLTLRPARCDPHAIAEDKLGTVLPLNVRLDGVPGGTAGIVDVAADTELKGRIQQFVHAACTAK